MLKFVIISAKEQRKIMKKQIQELMEEISKVENEKLKKQTAKNAEKEEREKTKTAIWYIMDNFDVSLFF